MAIVKVWRRPDDTFTTSSFSLSEKPEGESESDYVERMTADLKANNPNYLNRQEITTTSETIRQALLLSVSKDKRKLRVRQDETFYVDESAVTNQERFEQARLDAVARFQSLGFTNDEIKVILRRWNQ